MFHLNRATVAAHPLFFKSMVVFSGVLVYTGLNLIFEFFQINCRIWDILTAVVSIQCAVATAFCFIHLPASHKTRPVSVAVLISFLFSPAFIFFFSQTMYIRLGFIQPIKTIPVSIEDKTLFPKTTRFTAALTGAAVFFYLSRLFMLLTLFDIDALFISFLYGCFIAGLSLLFFATTIYILLKRKITKSFTILSGLFIGSWGMTGLLLLSSLFSFLIDVTLQGT